MEIFDILENLRIYSPPLGGVYMRKVFQIDVTRKRGEEATRAAFQTSVKIWVCKSWEILTIQLCKTFTVLVYTYGSYRNSRNPDFRLNSAK